MYGKKHALLGEGVSLLVHCSLHFARLLIFNSMCGLGISFVSAAIQESRDKSMEQKLRHKNIWSGKVKCIEVFKTWLNKSGRNQVVDSPKTGPPNAGLLCTSFFVPRFVIESSISSIKCVFQCWLKLIFPLFPTPTESSSQSICPASPLQMRTSSHLPRLVRDRLLKHLGESRTLNSCPSALAKIVLQANSWGVCSGFHWWAEAFGEAQRSTKHPQSLRTSRTCSHSELMSARLIFEHTLLTRERILSLCLQEILPEIASKQTSAVWNKFLGISEADQCWLLCWFLM